MSRTSFRVNLHSIMCLNVKELLAQSRCHIWTLSDSNGIWTHNHLIRKRIQPFKWLSVYKISGCGFESPCCHLFSKAVCYFLFFCKKVAKNHQYLKILDVEFLQIGVKDDLSVLSYLYKILWVSGKCVKFDSGKYWKCVILDAVSMFRVHSGFACYLLKHKKEEGFMFFMFFLLNKFANKLASSYVVCYYPHIYPRECNDQKEVCFFLPYKPYQANVAII